MKATAIRASETAGLARIGVDHPVVVATSARNGLAALRAAQVLAAHSGATVVALSVVEPELTAFYDAELGYLSPEYEGRRIDARLGAMRRQIARIAGEGAAWETVVRVGSADATITDEARDRHAGLIIMDSGRHNLAARLLVGETTLRAIRWANCPVLAVGKTFDDLPKMAIAAIDFSPSSIAAARSALSLLGDGATLYLMHVWRRSASDHPSERARDDAYERSLSGLFERLEAALDAPPGITVRTMSILGEPVEEVLGFAASHGADIIVAGRRGHGFFERLLVGSVTTALVRGAPCSVLVTPEPPLSEAERLSRSVTGTFESRRPDEWAAELDAFTRRNQGRRAALEADDPSVGRQMQARGYVFLGAVFDRNDQRAEVMLGDPDTATAHLTHTMSDVKLVAVRSSPGGKDDALLIAHGEGWGMLRFTGDDAATVAVPGAR